MKKTLFLTLAILASCILQAYQVVEVNNPLSGEWYSSGTASGGKLVAVQAFSTNATGTVALKTVYQAPIFTNAVKTATLTTNATTTTGTITYPVVKQYVTVTNTLVSGSCSSNVFSGSPATDTYLKAHEWIIFEGTATGGFIRLVLE